MARLFVLVIIVLVVGVIKSDESRQLKKVNKKKFLFNLLNVLRKLRSHKKTESSQTISLNQIKWPQLAANNQTQVKDVVPIASKLSKYHGFSERSGVGKSPSKSHKLVQKSKKEFLIDLLKTLKRIRSRKKTAHSKSTERKSTSFVKLESRISRPFPKNDTTFKTSNNTTKKAISDPKQKFDERSNIIKPIEELAYSEASLESKARYSFALARLSFLETLEKAQEKKLNKLSKVEKEFAVILRQKTDENILGEQKTKKHSLQHVTEVETGTTLDNIPSSYESLPSSKSALKKKNPLDISLDVSSKTMKDEHSRTDKNIVKGKKNIESQSAKFTSKNRIEKKVIPPQLHPITPESTNGNKHLHAIRNKLRKFQKDKKAFSALVNEFLVTHTFSNKSKNLARLQKLQQKILLSFRENKTKSALNENIDNNKNRQLHAAGGSFQDKAQNKSILNVPAHFMSNKYDFSDLQSTASTKVNEIVQNEKKKNPTDSLHGMQTKLAKDIASRNLPSKKYKVNKQDATIQPLAANGLPQTLPKTIGNQNVPSSSSLVAETHNNLSTPYSNTYNPSNQTVNIHPGTVGSSQQISQNVQEHAAYKLSQNHGNKITQNKLLQSPSDHTSAEHHNMVAPHSAPGRLGLNNQAVMSHIKIDRLHQNPGNVTNTAYKFRQNIKEKVTEIERPQSVLRERAHDPNKPLELVEPHSSSSVYSFNNHTVEPRPNIVGQNSSTWEKIAQNKLLQSPSDLTHEGPHKIVAPHSAPGRLGINNQAVTSRPKMDRLQQNPVNYGNTATHPHLVGKNPSNQETKVSGVYQKVNETSKDNKTLQDSSNLMHEMQNQSPSHVASSFASNKIGFKNSTGTPELGIDSVARQSSQNLKNNTNVTKISAALQRAQSIFLTKVKEILVGHRKNKDRNNNHFSGTNNQDNNNQKTNESVINSSAYVMDESPPTTPAPENHDHAGIVPTTPPNSALPLSTGNVMSPVMQQPNMGFNAPGQGLTKSTSMSNSPVQPSIAGQPLTYTQQQDAHLEEKIAAEQNNAFQNTQNSLSPSMNGGNLPYQAPSSFAASNELPEVRHNAGFRLPNVDDLDEYRGGMERYQLAHALGFSQTGYDIDDESPSRSHFHHYAHDDEVYNDEDYNDDDDEDNDEYNDDKKKSHIRKPHGHKQNNQKVFTNKGTVASRSKHTQMPAKKHVYRKS